MTYRAQQGFTLIETLVAVLLLTTAIAGPLTIASRGLLASTVARDQVIAFYLAQDAIEHIRFLRDTNKLSSAEWLNTLTPCVSADGSATCYFDSLSTNPSSPTACSGTCEVMRFDSTNGYYNYNSSNTLTPQRFIRTVSIKTPVGTNNSEAAISVTMSWESSNGATRTVTVRENIVDWQ